jgi:hypothetical protein
VTPGEVFKLAQLTAETRERVLLLIEAMARRGLDVYVGQTLRTQAQQAEAQARGVTSAHQDRSWHQLGRAADLRKRNADGSIDETTHDEGFFRALWEDARAVGLRSLAYHDDGTKLLIKTTHGEVWDAGHVEWRGDFATLADAFAAEGPKVA